MNNYWMVGAVMLLCVSCQSGQQNDPNANVEPGKAVVAENEITMAKKDNVNPLDAGVYMEYETAQEGTLVYEQRNDEGRFVTYRYKTSGTCSKLIQFDIDDNRIVHNVYYFKGCNGNTQGVCALVEGLTVEVAIEKLGGIMCASTHNTTSCPDQLARALKLATQNK